MENYEADSSFDFGKLSKINSAGLVNSTLSNLWTDFFRHLRNGEFSDANNDLDCLWTILGGEKNIEGKTDEKEFKDIQNKLKNVTPLINSIPSKGFKQMPYVLSIKDKQKSILSEKALFLRRLQNKQGKGTAYGEGDDEDFD